MRETNDSDFLMTRKKKLSGLGDHLQHISQKVIDHGVVGRAKPVHDPRLVSFQMMVFAGDDIAGISAIKAGDHGLHVLCASGMLVTDGRLSAEVTRGRAPNQTV